MLCSPITVKHILTIGHVRMLITFLTADNCELCFYIVVLSLIIPVRLEAPAATSEIPQRPKLQVGTAGEAPQAQHASRRRSAQVGHVAIEGVQC